IDLVNDYTIDLAGSYFGEEPCQGRPVHVATGEAAVVVTVGQAVPAGVGLASDVGFGRFALGIQGGKLPLSLLGGFARVDRTANHFAGGGVGCSVHEATPFPLSRKKR